MANTTTKGYTNIHGGNPQALIEKVIRSRIYDCQYWKEHCFALTAESLIDKTIAINSVGGVFANQRPTEFLCLTLKLLQLQPEKEILMEYLLAEEFKYLRALAAFYVRLTFRSVEVYEILEPLMKDYKKLRLRDDAGYSILHFDEFIDQLLHEDRVFDIILPRLTKRDVLEETEGLAKRVSVLEEALDGPPSPTASPSRHRHGRSGKERAGEGSDVEMEDGEERGRSRSRSRSASGSEGGRYVSRSPSGSRSRSRSRSGSVDSWKSRERSISPDRLERIMAEAVGVRGRSGAEEGRATMEDEDGEKLEGDV